MLVLMVTAGVFRSAFERAERTDRLHLFSSVPFWCLPPPFFLVVSFFLSVLGSGSGLLYLCKKAAFAVIP